MLIVNADDFGKTKSITDNIVRCFQDGRITSTSAMVFMLDSERAAHVALEQKLEVGLHLNFDDPFTGTTQPTTVKECIERTSAFLGRSKYAQVLYNPMLRKPFEYLYQVQYEEFIRLYRRPPTHINGHHHMHLCSNVLFGNIIPAGSRVRRSFTFSNGERSGVNRLYRKMVDAIITRRFISSDAFFAVAASAPLSVLSQNVKLAKSQNVELMVHMSSHQEIEFIMQPCFLTTIKDVPLGTYCDLPGRVA
mgnify:CR=1 FL=1